MQQDQNPCDKPTKTKVNGDKNTFSKLIKLVFKTMSDILHDNEILIIVIGAVTAVLILAAGIAAWIFYKRHKSKLNLGKNGKLECSGSNGVILIIETWIWLDIVL